MAKSIFLIALLVVNAITISLGRKHDERIFGGDDSLILDYPYQVSLEIEGDHWCGGSIISDKYVLTAGHCVEDFKPQEMMVRVGSSWLGKGGDLYSVKKFIANEKYYTRRDGTPVNDIALIELARPIVFNKTRKPIEMFKANERIRRGAKCTVSGWGTTDKLDYQGQLQSVSVPIVSLSDCKRAYSFKADQLVPYVPDGQICAGLLGVGGKDACQGDSGGPLVVEGRLAGVVSWGQGCADPNFPGVYTEVAYYRNWIKKNSGV